MNTPEQAPHGNKSTSSDEDSKRAPRDISAMIDRYYARQGKPVEKLENQKDTKEEGHIDEIHADGEAVKESKEVEALKPEEVDTIPEDAVEVREANETEESEEKTDEEKPEETNEGNTEDTKEDTPSTNESHASEAEAKQQRKEAREKYKAHRKKMDEAREEFMSATETYWQAKRDMSILDKIKIFDSSPVEEQEKAMLEAQEKYDALLDELRDKRQERMDAYAGKGKELNDSEKALYTEQVARHEALLDSHIDNEVQLLESLRYKRDEKGESRNFAVRYAKRGWNYYKNCPRKKRLLIASGIAGAGGVLLGPGLTVAGFAAGGVAAGSRFAGGFFGGLAALETKRFGDRVAEKSGERELGKQKAQFEEKKLSKSRKERLKINRNVHIKKNVSTGAAIGSALLVGGKASDAVEAASDAVTDGLFSPNSAMVQPHNEIEGKSGTKAVSEDTIEQKPENDSTGSEKTAEELEKERKDHARAQRRERIAEARAETQETITLANKLADQMGIDTTEGIRFKAEGHIPTEIYVDGETIPVPMELLSEEQQASVERAREIRDLMEGNVETETPQKNTPNVSYLESDIQERVDHIESTPDTGDTQQVKQTDLEETTSKKRTPPEHVDENATQEVDVETKSVEESEVDEDTEKEKILPPEETHEVLENTTEEAPTEELDPEEIDTKDLYKPVEDDSHMPEAGDLPAPTDEEVHMPEAGDTAELHESARLADVEIADLYSRFREGVEEPEELKMEGVYEKGSSVERELQQFLESNNWIEERYPDITETQKGEIAHRIRLALEEHPDMEDKLHVQNGDWNKVLEDDSYSFYIDRELVEHEIQDVLGITEQEGEVPVLDEVHKTVPEEETVPVLEESQKTKVFDETKKTAPEPEDVPVFDKESKIPASVHESGGLADAELEEIPEKTEDINKVPEEPTPVIEETPNTEAEISEKQSTSVAEESLEALRGTEEGAEEGTTEEPTLAEDLAQAKEALQNEGADYQGLQTRPHIEQFFKDGLFEHSALQGQYQEIRSNWGIISHARMEDIFDTNKSLTFNTDTVPITMGAEAEQLCRSIVQQLDKGLQGTVPNFEELLDEAQEKNITLGEFVAQLTEEMEENIPEVQESIIDVPTVSLDSLEEAPAIQELSAAETIDGVTKTHEVTLPKIETDDIQDSTHNYIEREFSKNYANWSTGDVKTLYENDETFKKVFDTELVDIIDDIRGSDSDVLLENIAVDWSALEGLTPVEALEQLHELENTFEEINATETIIDPNTTANI